MSIRNEFEKIDPTEKQKKDIFRRIEESSKVKTDFRHQVIATHRLRRSGRGCRNGGSRRAFCDKGQRY